MSDLFGNQIVGFPTRRLICRIFTVGKLYSYPPDKYSYITITGPCNVYPLIPHFYIVKLGFTGVYLILLFLIQKIDCFEQTLF